jgi:hypothetical protein
VIWNALFELVKDAVGLLTGLLPTIAAPDFAGMIQSTKTAPGEVFWAFAYVRYANYYVPASDAVLIIGIRAAVFAAMQVVDLTSWVLSKTHVAGGS